MMSKESKPLSTVYAKRGDAWNGCNELEIYNHLVAKGHKPFSIKIDLFGGEYRVADRVAQEVFSSVWYYVAGGTKED